MSKKHTNAKAGARKAPRNKAAAAQAPAKTNLLLPAAAVLVGLAALGSVLVPQLLPARADASAAVDAASPTSAAPAADASFLTEGIDPAAIGTTASYFDYDADGTTVELFAVQDADGGVRMALNTCQVCNGSPYAYFEQQGDTFVCQNCGNAFAASRIGVESGGCNPVPVTADAYTEEEGRIYVSEEFLAQNAVRFTNWKNF